MSVDVIKGQWNIVQGKIQQKFAKLLDDDLVYAQGKEQELMGRIQKSHHDPNDSEKKLFHEHFHHS